MLRIRELLTQEAWPTEITEPKTDTGGLALNAKTIEIIVSKELCKIAP